MSQEYRIEEEGQRFPQSLVFQVFGEDKIKLFNIQQGQLLTIDFDANTSEYNGRFYTKLSCYNITRTQEYHSDPTVNPAAAASLALQAAAPPAVRAAGFTPADQATVPAGSPAGKATDDLPF